MQEQPACSEPPPEYEGRLVLDPILINRAHLFGALEAGAFELANTRTFQNVVLHHLGSSVTESAIFLRELTAMVGRPYRVGVMEELSPGELAQVVLAHQGIGEEVMEDKGGSHGDPNQGVVLDESPVEQARYSTFSWICTIRHVYAHNISTFCLVCWCVP